MLPHSMRGETSGSGRLVRPTPPFKVGVSMTTPATILQRPSAGTEQRRCSLLLPTALLASVLGVGNAVAGIADVLRDPRFDRLGLAPIAPVLANTVASTYPVASASSSVIYAYNPELDALERQAGVAGPIIGERAETIGKGQFTLAASYSYVHLTTINGEDLDSLLN